jgi:hypothetical protein
MYVEKGDSMHYILYIIELYFEQCEVFAETDSDQLDRRSIE